MKLAPQLARPLRAIARAGAASGVPVYLVGGCVRDGLLGRAVRDVDLAVEGDAAELARRARLPFEVFDRFGTARVALPGGARVDLARARRETYAFEAALPDVSPAPLAEDLARRDFTVNAMARALSPAGEGPLIDPLGGEGDLRAKRLRVLHAGSFRDDPTRLFRAARYAGRLGLKPEPETARLLRESVADGGPGRLSRERVRQELVRILEEADPEPAMRLLKAWGLFPFIHPRFRWPAAARRPAEPLVRLGLCALAMAGDDGVELVRSLPVGREASLALLEALRLHGERSSPRTRLNPLARVVLERAAPRLRARALEPLLLGGEDLRRAGLPPGRVYAELLRKAARAQWRGEFGERAGALRWLKRNLWPARSARG